MTEQRGEDVTRGAEATCPSCGSDLRDWRADVDEGSHYEPVVVPCGDRWHGNMIRAAMALSSVASAVAAQRTADREFEPIGTTRWIQDSEGGEYLAIVDEGGYAIDGAAGVEVFRRV